MTGERKNRNMLGTEGHSFSLDHYGATALFTALPVFCFLMTEEWLTKEVGDSCSDLHKQASKHATEVGWAYMDFL